LFRDYEAAKSSTAPAWIDEELGPVVRTDRLEQLEEEWIVGA